MKWMDEFSNHFFTETKRNNTYTQTNSSHMFVNKFHAHIMISKSLYLSKNCKLKVFLSTLDPDMAVIYKPLQEHKYSNKII